MANPYIPAATPTSVLRSQISCGYYPNTDGREVSSYFTYNYNGLGFIDMGYSNSNLNFFFAKKPTSVVRVDGKPIVNDATKIVNATAGSFVAIPASALAYIPNILLVTFDEPKVAAGKVTFEVGFDPNSKNIWVDSMDVVTKTFPAGVASETWSGAKPFGKVEGVFKGRDSTIKVFGSQGLYFPVSPLNMDWKYGATEYVGSNFYHSVEVVDGRNSGPKSTQKLAYVLKDNTGCEAISYIEIK